jgi:2-oxoglutarate ferredoxin oxidoreductase subunit delta
MPMARIHATAYISLNTRQCQACWDCIEACPNGVLGKVKMLFHKHARIDHPDRCDGCGTCASICPDQAITLI